MLELEINKKIYKEIFNLVELSGGINGTSKVLKVKALKKALTFNIGDTVKLLANKTLPLLITLFI